jgi:hypothetical protein
MSDPVTSHPFAGNECPDPVNTLDGVPLPTLNGPDLTAAGILADETADNEVTVNEDQIIDVD